MDERLNEFYNAGNQAEDYDNNKFKGDSGLTREEQRELVRILEKGIEVYPGAGELQALTGS